MSDAQSEAWEFAMNEARLWEWKTVEPHSRTELRRSTSAFQTLLQCVNDAAAHGYDRRAGRGERRALQ